MAVFETTRPMIGTAIGARIGAYFAAIIDWNNQRVTRNALNKLSARELNDIGLNLGEVDRINA